MEVLSGVSSTFAVVSLAIELGGKIKKLCNFWSSIKEAPKEIRSISRDLNIISDVLDDIRQDTDSARPQLRALSASLAALEQCSDSLETLQEYVDELAPGLVHGKRRVRKWAAFQAAWKEEKLTRFQAVLRDMKLTLILARQNSTNRTTLAYQDSSQQNLTFIAQGMGLLLEEQASRTVTTKSSASIDMDEHLMALQNESQRLSSSISNPIARFGFEKTIESAISQFSNNLDVSKGQRHRCHPLLNTESQRIQAAAPTENTERSTCSKSTYRYSNNSIFGTIFVSSTTTESVFTSIHEAEPDQHHSDEIFKIETSFTAHPSQWLQLCGINHGIRIALSKTLQGVDCRLRTYRAVSDDAPIFELCRLGKSNEIRHLFDKKLASPWDTNSKGQTPLHQAAQNARSDTCHLLITQGADLDAMDNYGRSVAYYAFARDPCCFWPLASSSSVWSCKAHIDTMRLFLEKLDTSSQEASNALSYLMTSNGCGNRACSHPPGFRESFEWAFPFLKDSIFQVGPSTRKINATYLIHAMRGNDIDIRPLARLLPFVEDINADRRAEDNVWVPLGHGIAHKICGGRVKHWQELQGFAHLLVPKGLDLHAPWNIENSRVNGSTPTSSVLNFSRHFFEFRELLRSQAIDIPKFVEDELRQKPLPDAGWTKESLQELFELEFEPMTVQSRCPCCNASYHTWDAEPGDLFYGREKSWLNMLKRLREMQKDGTSIEEILRIRNQDILDLKEPILGICVNLDCEIGKLNRTKEEEPEEEGSPFLLSI
ncbi:hypothetical protein BKA64DRAFT_722511 [Cadophora sp. MPI-SDFR-AT-0126]|nr:hypothetical protein BKA64DRAFT_722511 [Leotiomycetes sp. MPI-SDFR-AT-0126]